MRKKLTDFFEKAKKSYDRAVNGFATTVVKKRLWFIIAFAVVFVAFLVCYFFVDTNYDSTAYLPADSEVKSGLGAMYETFGHSGNGSVMVAGATEEVALKYAEAVEFKNKIKSVNGVKDVLFLDDLFSGITGSLPGDATQEEYAETILILLNIVKGEDFGNGNFELDFNLPTSTIADIVGTLLSGNKGYGAKVNEELATGNYDISKSRFVTVLKTMIVNLSNIDGFDASNFNLSEAGELINGFSESLAMFYAKNKSGKYCALLQVTFNGTDYAQETMSAIDEIRDIGKESGYGIYMSGNSATTYNSIDCVNKQTLYALIAVGIVVMVILFALSTSFWEPILYLIAIGVAVVINMGSNIVLGSVSYLTSGVAGILQLALSMDYSIFLLTRYKQEKQKQVDKETAMINAIKASIRPISASSLTTVASFVAIMFMSYSIGLDMGIVFAKGVILSLLSVFMLLPGLAIYTDKLIVKTTHKSVKLTLYKYTGALMKVRYVVPVLALAVIVAGFVGQSYLKFGYGDTATFGSEGSLIYEDKSHIESVFGRQNQLAVILKKSSGDKVITGANGTITVEQAITEDLAKKDFVLTAQSVSVIKASGMQAILPDKFLAQFDADGEYTRIVTYIDLDEEGEATEKAINEVREVITSYGVGKGEYYLVGGSSSAIEIKEIVNLDYNVITWVSIGLVALILLISFRNFVLPILLILVIQGSVWISTSIDALTGNVIVFLGYMIVSAVMLGATVDYGILLTSNYLEEREKRDKIESIKQAIARSSRAILTSSIILCAAGYVIALTSSMPAIAIFGKLIGRTALASMILVLACLPSLLVIFDKIIQKTTFGKKKIHTKTVTAPLTNPTEKETESVDEAAATCDNEKCEE